MGMFAPVLAKKNPAVIFSSRQENKIFVNYSGLFFSVGYCPAVNCQILVSQFEV